MSSLSPVTGSYFSFYSQYPMASVDVHRYLGIEVISEAYVFWLPEQKRSPFKESGEQFVHSSVKV